MSMQDQAWTGLMLSKDPGPVIALPERRWDVGQLCGRDISIST